MSYLSRLEAEKRPEGQPSKGAEGGSDPFAGDASGPFPGLPGEIVTGLLKLQVMRPPRITRPAVWPEIVADAQRLGSDGWAQQALALGWHPLQLFGCSPIVNAKGGFEGLVVWLCGRRIVLFDENCCVVVDGSHSRAVFTRRTADGARYIWEIGQRG